MLYHWRDKYPEYYDAPIQKHWKQASAELKRATIERCAIKGESVQSVSKDIGYTPSLIYKWLRDYRQKGHVSAMKKSPSIDPSDITSAEDLEAIKAQMLDMQMEIDILKETINVLKKDPGVDQTALRNREKVVIIGALKDKYSLPLLLDRLGMPRSSYFYQLKVLNKDFVKVSP